jgi:CRP-like cAMP-binding protein
MTNADAPTPTFPPPRLHLSAIAPGCGNQLLAALQDAVWDRWGPQLQAVTLSQGQVLCEAGSTPLHAVFPVDAAVSLLYLTRDGASAEVAVVGRSGMVGLPLLMGGDSLSFRAVVQAAGGAWRLPATVLRQEMQRSGPALALLLRWVLALAAEVAQSAACNRHHSIEQQLCRRLLIGLDSAGGTELLLTHEAAAQLLGVRRESVTAAALKLQQAGAIRYHRGRIQVLNRSGLEQHSCECYASTRREQLRLLPEGVRPAAARAPGRMSPPGRPKGEYRSAQHEGTPVSAQVAPPGAAAAQRIGWPTWHAAG